MIAYCEHGHERAQMRLDHVNQTFVCDAPVRDKMWMAARPCGARVTPEAIRQETPQPYRSMDGIALALLDADIAGVVSADGSLRIEYPRRADLSARKES